MAAITINHSTVGKNHARLNYQYVSKTSKNSMVYSTFQEWERLTIDRTKNDAAFHIWMSA